MSTLRLTTISNQTGSSSVPSETVINGSAKAWVNFNGTGTVAIRASFNVSSITDNGAGNYTVNFTTAFADANYATQYMNDNGARYLWIDTVTTSSVKVYCFGPSAYFDTGINCVSVFR
jgi:hypothetical protein